MIIINTASSTMNSALKLSGQSLEQSWCPFLTWTQGAQTPAGDFSMLTARWAGQRLERANAPPCWHLGLPITSEHAMIRTIIL